MAQTSATYEGTGAQVNFTVPFPFISRDHVHVFLNAAEVLQPSIWYWVSDSTITFRNAPADGASIKIQRVTPGDTRLVNFQNGAVLTEADLDLSANQIFYLAQETKENYASLVNDELVRVGTSQGIVTTDPDLIIAGLVEKMLEFASADVLEAAVGDIDLQGEILLDIQTKLDGSIEVIDLIGVFNGDQSAFILDTSKVKIDSDGGDTFAQRLSTLAAADSANSASITTINSVTIPGVQSDVDDLDSDVTGLFSDVGVLEALYGVTLNVNGYITGFAQNNNGQTGSFVVLADKFAVVHPSGDPGETEFVPFSVSGGSVFMNDVIARTVRHGQTAFDTGTGYWLGDVGGVGKMSLGNSSGNKMTWDGSTLAITGSIDFANATQSFTPSVTGYATPPSPTMNYLDLGKIVIMWSAGGWAATSNATTMTFTNLPSSIRPSGTREVPCQVRNEGVDCAGSVTFGNTGTATFNIGKVTAGSFLQMVPAGFTASGTKGLTPGFAVVYSK